VRRWAFLLVPGLLLRSLIPIGFMPMFGPGLSVSLMLCPAYAPLAAAPVGDSFHRSSPNPLDDLSMSMSGDMDMSTDAPSTGNVPAPGKAPLPSNGWGQDHSLCPYATSAILAGPTPLFALAVAKKPGTDFTKLAPQIAYFLVVRRAQSARAPPLPV